MTEAVEPATPSRIERSTESAGFRSRVETLIAGVFPAILVVAVGVSHGGYFPTAWGPLTLALLAVAAAALLVRPRPMLGIRELLVPGLLAAITVWALASAAWGSPTEAVPEAQRTLAYSVGALAFAAVLARGGAASFVTGLWVGITAVSMDALAGRLFPERFGEYDPISVYRLSEPVGYWNALGVLAGLGLLLGLALAARAESLVVRLAAAGSTVPLALTLYFTFSRGAWVSLAAGLVLVLLLDPRRLQLGVTFLVVAPWSALAVGLSSRSEPLTETGHTLASASADGHQVAAVGVGLALVAAAAAAFVAGLRPRVELPARVARAANAVLVAALAAAVAIGVVALGGPSHIARSFAAAPRGTGGDLDERLFDLSGNGRVDGWEAALDDAREQVLVGSGGGSYERYWLAHRPNALVIRDAHSLYLESLAEYGPLGLALIISVLGLPLVVAVRLRRRPLVPVAAGVVGLYALHAGIDWDWEFPVLTLVALGGAAVIMRTWEARAVATSFGRMRTALLLVLAALVPVAALGAFGARAEAASVDAAEERDYETAKAEARRAERLVPWSVGPVLLLGRAQAAAGERNAARKTFQRALRREPDRWRLWYELAAVSRGAERSRALREARALNPREPLLAELPER